MIQLDWMVLIASVTYSIYRHTGIGYIYIGVIHTVYLALIDIEFYSMYNLIN